MVKLKINQENQIEDGKTVKDQNVKSNDINSKHLNPPWKDISKPVFTIIIILDDRDITRCQKPIKF